MPKSNGLFGPKEVNSGIKTSSKSSNLFGPEEVNSGSTDYRTITIWRSEEHFKVILHESIHFFNLDGSLDLSDQNDKINLIKT